MSSNVSNSNSPADGNGARAAAANCTRPRRLVGLLLILLSVLVWAIAPGRTRLAPAPLKSLPPGCPHRVADFVPSDVTEVPGIDLGTLPPVQRNHLLFRLNMEPCPCGCNTSVAACLAQHRTCSECQDLARKMLAEERASGPPAGK